MLQKINFSYEDRCKREFIPSINPSLHPYQTIVYLHVHVLYLKVICIAEDAIKLISYKHFKRFNTYPTSIKLTNEII